MFLRRKFLGEAPVSESEAIEGDLVHLFATRRGTGCFLPNFGFTDTGYRTPTERVERLSAEIRENLRLFEPRLQVVEIDDRYQEDGNVQLHVHCRVLSTQDRVQLVVGPKGELLKVGAAEHGADGDG